MKDNIDLTQDRDFPGYSGVTSDPLFNISSNVDPVAISIFKTFFAIPWKFKPIDSEEYFKEDQLFPVGDKQQLISQYRRRNQFEENICSKCGRRFKIIPWKFTFISDELCEKCSKTKSYEKIIPWN